MDWKPYFRIMKQEYCTRNSPTMMMAPSDMIVVAATSSSLRYSVTSNNSSSDKNVMNRHGTGTRTGTPVAEPVAPMVSVPGVWALGTRTWSVPMAPPAVGLQLRILSCRLKQQPDPSSANQMSATRRGASGGKQSSSPESLPLSLPLIPNHFITLPSFSFFPLPSLSLTSPTLTFFLHFTNCIRSLTEQRHTLYFQFPPIQADHLHHTPAHRLLVHSLSSSLIEIPSEVTSEERSEINTKPSSCTPLLSASCFCPPCWLIAIAMVRARATTSIIALCQPAG